MAAARREGSDTEAKNAWESRTRGDEWRARARRGADFSARAYRYRLSTGRFEEESFSRGEGAGLGAGHVRHERRFGFGDVCGRRAARRRFGAAEATGFFVDVGRRDWQQEFSGGDWA